MPQISPIISGEPLVPVREAQKNITRYFKEGLARVTKNGKSLGYLISDDMLQEIIEGIQASKPVFIKSMEKIAKKKGRISLDKVLYDEGKKQL